MKILIGILLALFISGQAYAQSATEVIRDGVTIRSYKQSDHHWLFIIYKDKP